MVIQASTLDSRARVHPAGSHFRPRMGGILINHWYGYTKHLQDFPSICLVHVFCEIYLMKRQDNETVLDLQTDPFKDFSHSST